MEFPPLLKILSVVVGEGIVEGSKENLFPFVKLVESCKPLLGSIISVKEEGIAFRNEGLKK